MKNVKRIIILYPGETSSERINSPGNYSLSRLLIWLHERGDVPIYFLNSSPRHEQYGNIEFIHFTGTNFLRLLRKLACQRNTLIINQTEVYAAHTRLLRAAMPGSRVIVRFGGVYYGRQHLASPAFERERRRVRRRLAHADIVISTADGTPVDFYMERVGVPPSRYRKWMNGFPTIPNDGHEPRANQILCISRLSHEKAIDYVMRSFAAALPRLAEPHTLVIVGDGPESSALKHLANELGVGASVEFVGEAYDVSRYFYSSRLFLSGLANNTIMEAIVTATPVVALELGEIRALYSRFPNVHIVDFARGGYGRIDPASMDDLVRRTADLVVDLINHPERHAHASSPCTAGVQSWEQRLRAEVELYEELLSPSGPPS